jgi:pimeloyl-ACP methyl ester carboxylesterase
MSQEPVVLVHGGDDLPSVLHFHSPGAFPLEVDGLAPMAKAAGVRVLGLEREVLQGPGLDSVAGVAKAAVEHMNASLPERFGVLGWSGGAPFALGAAALFPERVGQAVVVCPLPGWLRGDGAVPASTARLAAIASGNLPGPFSADMDVLAEPWKFEIEAISVPLIVWYSDDDPVIPSDLVEQQLGALPSSSLHRFPTGGHFLPMGKWDELLRVAAGLS